MRPASLLRIRTEGVSPGGAEGELAAILENVRIEPPGTIRYGNLDPVKAATASPEPQAGGLPAALADALTPLIYHYGYARAATVGAAELAQRAAAQAGDIEGDREFVASLGAANRSRERWDPMWRVYQVNSNGALSLEKRGTYREATSGSYIFTDSPGRSPSTGDFVALHVPKESTKVQAGFYFAFGETLASEFDDARLARFYFNIAAQNVPALLEWLSADLNRYRIPYRLKCLAKPAFYDRLDPVVLYLAKRFVPSFLRLANGRRQPIDDMLRDGTPLFTKPMLRGLGAADEPGGRQSFGQSRSRLVAEGIVAAWLTGEESIAKRLEKVAARFQALGLCLQRPYLEEGARDLYEWPAAN